MIHFDTFTSGVASIKGVASKGGAAVALLGLVAGLTLASPAAAETFFVSSVTPVTQDYTVNANLGQDSLYLQATPFVVQTDTSSFLAFCIDMFHAEAGGLQFHDETLANDSRDPSPNPLTSGQVTMVGRLVNYGTTLYGSGLNLTGGDMFSLAAIQGAIWQVINPDYSVVGSFAIFDPNDPLTQQIAAYAQGTGVSTTPTDFRTIFDANHDVQGLAFAGVAPGGVPEPESWALMLTGFLGLGGLLRVRRARRAVQEA